jgi:formate dehydrogenase maturation protein FdhE
MQVFYLHWKKLLSELLKQKRQQEQEQVVEILGQLQQQDIVFYHKWVLMELMMEQVSL